MVLAWLPALLVLSGRMYVRPETLTLLYLSIFLAVVSRWDRFPRLALLLPLVQVAWVNSQGLFVLGPIILVFGLIDAALRFGSLRARAKEMVAHGTRRQCWQPALACLINPYFITGALYPLELAGTMRNPIFSHNIAELMPIPDFIASAGLRNLPLQLHFATIILGALSFLIPLVWTGWLSGLLPVTARSEPASTRRSRSGERRSRVRSRGKKRDRKAVVRSRRPSTSGRRAGDSARSGSCFTCRSVP